MIDAKNQFHTSASREPLDAQLQGRDSIDINAPMAHLWTLISDSNRLLDWGPPVTAIEVIDYPEGVGTRRRVDAEFNGKTGYFIERRIEHVDGKKTRFVIEEDSFGLSRMMTESGASLELIPLDKHHTRVVFSFYHNPKGLLGQVMNWLIILRQQRKNRLLALESLKTYAEKTYQPNAN